MVDLSIVVPCYNEAGNIPLIIKSFDAICASDKNIEVLLVDNGSTDNSAEVFEQQLQGKNNIKLVKVTQNQGYGYGILAGLEQAQGKLLAWTHADMQTDPEDVITAYKLYLQKQEELQRSPNKESKLDGFDRNHIIIKGHRKKRKLTEAFFSWGMQVLCSIVLGTALEEINAQPKLFSRQFYQEYIQKDAPYDFSLDLYLLYQAKKYGKTFSIPVYFKPRLHGEAKGGGSFKTRIKLIQRTLAYIFELSAKLIKS